MLTANYKTIVMVHDHDYYCLRKHKYFPVTRKNCYKKFDTTDCSLCSMLIEKSIGFPHLKLINLKRQKKLLYEIKKADKFLVLSEFMKSNLIQNEFNPTKIEKIRPFKDLIKDENEFKEISGELLYVGQIIRGKGVDILIKALNYVEKDFHLNIVGQGNDIDYIKYLVGLYGLDDKIDFIGWTQDVDSYYRKTDIVLVPSRWQEPFGLIGMEAFSHKKPVIGIDNGGIAEWLKHNENGFLAENEQEFAKYIDRLIDNQQLIDQMGNNGYKMIKKKYQKENFIAKFKEVSD
jgi:glycosyltransferase involved in cell wall biosynthesis